MPVAMDPSLGFVDAGLKSARRAMSHPAARSQVSGVLAAPPRSADGPVARLRQVMEHAELRPLVERLVHDAALDVDARCRGL
eukprot:9351462-Pyramimonas_sp.AAC.1